MNIIVLDKTYIAEFPTISGGNPQQQVFFPVLNNLDGKITQGIETYSVSVISKTLAGATLANDALLACSYLFLIVGDVNQIWGIPLSNLMTIQKLGATPNYVPYVVELNNLKVIWAKSYVFVADTTKLVAGENFMFNIKYADEESVMDKK